MIYILFYVQTGFYTTSGSMGLTDDGYALQRLAYAKIALNEFIDSMDSQDYIMSFGFLSTAGPEGNIGDLGTYNNMKTWISGLTASGQTPLYGAVERAFNAITTLKTTNEANDIYWNYAIVAMTDGAATDDFTSACQLFTGQASLSSDWCNLNAVLEGTSAFSKSSDIVHLFPIVFGEDKGAIEEKPNLKRMADISSGANFSADADELTDTYYLISLEL